MNFLPTFGFKGSVLPIIDSTNKLYLLVENDNDHRVLLNVIFYGVNKFINIDPKSSKIIRAGNYKSNFQLKIFYMGQELFDFTCDDINKEHLLMYSNYILKKELVVNEISFHPTFIDGVKLTSTSDKPQNLYIIITNNDTNDILCEDNFISNEPYIFDYHEFINYKLSVYNVCGEKIYDYDMNLKDKKVWVKFESISIGESIAWIPYVEEFRKKHQCKLLCTTHWNKLFITEYPNIEFVSSEEIVELSTLFAVYKIRHDDWESNFEKTACKFLGLNHIPTKLNEVLEHIKTNSTINTN